MENGKKIRCVDLTHPDELQTLIESRRVFNLQNCELNIFESYQQAYQVPLAFNNLVITSMVQGKKVMHLNDRPSFEYLPGETLVVPAQEPIRVDFPTAVETPVQCIALAVDESYIRNTLQYLNDFYNTEKDKDWSLHFNQYHFANDNEMSELINKMIRVCCSTERSKNIYADLNLKELLIRLVQSQQLLKVEFDSKLNSNKDRWHFVLDYIHNNLGEKINIDELSSKTYMNRSTFFKSFKEQFGVTPVDYINRERLRMAKKLLANTNDNITQISWQTGFSDVNYFVRLFKKTEGLTPGGYRNLVKPT